ncbi:MAG: class I SAM-dependent methyltransferase [Pseudomonadota bacterium]
MTNYLINIAERYRTFSDDDWAEILRRSGTHPEIDGIMFPGVPSDEFQRIFVGSTLSENVEEPLLYYKSIKNMYSAIGGEFGSKTRLLDVGSGWGRIIRFFLKDLSPKNLFGCDVSKDSITTCMDLFHGEVDFKLINPLPPSQYESDFFDLVEGYSVFSHLSLYAATLWMNEYCRILKPGGLLALTVWKRQRLDYIAGIQKEPIAQKEKDSYMHMMQTSFSDQCSLEKMLYDATGVVYIPYSGDIDSTYGESFLSPEMLKEHWAPMFEYLDTVPLDVDQQIVFFRKKNEAKILSEHFLHMLGKFALITDVQAICMHSYRKSNVIE